MSASDGNLLDGIMATNDGVVDAGIDLLLLQRPEGGLGGTEPPSQLAIRLVFFPGDVRHSVGVVLHLGGLEVEDGVLGQQVEAGLGPGRDGGVRHQDAEAGPSPSAELELGWR